MSEPLKAEILHLPEAAWQVEREEPGAIHGWAEVAYVPSDGAHRKERPCVRRYLAVRIQKRPGSLFADGSPVHCFAVVTNRTEDGLALLQGHRQKAGPVEQTPHVLKTELAAAALPSEKFGANAAWFRLNVLTHNLLTALERLTVPGDLRTARPNRLRFCSSTPPGRSSRMLGGRSCGSRESSSTPYRFGRGARSPDWLLLSRRLGYPIFT